MTIGEAIGRVKIALKQAHMDSKLSNRAVFNALQSSLDYFLDIEDGKMGIMKSDFLFKTLFNVELKEIDAIRACGIDTDCVIKRSKDKLPSLRRVGNKVFIKRVSSLDGLIELQTTTPSSFARKRNLSTSKYDTNLYYWYEDGYLYVPNVSWDSVMVEAYFDNSDEIDSLNNCNESSEVGCKSKLEETFQGPSHLIDMAIEKTILGFGNSYSRLPDDNNINKNVNSVQ